MFLWRKEYELGIETIDDQHKNLIRIGNVIYDLIKQQSEDKVESDNILAVIMELKRYTEYHFSTEEQLFKMYNYPDMYKHKMEHDNFVYFLDSLDIQDLVGNEEEVLEKLLRKIIDWTFNHIITSDYMYKDYLLDLGKNKTT